MRSKVVSLFDYKNMEIPQEMREWHIKDEEIKAALEIISKEKAEIQSVDTVQIGDSVACKCISGDDALKIRTVLIFPGRNMPSAENAEKEIVGKAVGESFSCTLGKFGEVTLEITECRRLVDKPIDDSLIELLGIDGVSTVEQYYKWYREFHAEEAKQKAALEIARLMMSQIHDNTEVYIDEQELSEYKKNRGKALYDIYLDAGSDPHLTPDGEYLSDEEALARMVEAQGDMFSGDIINIHLAELDGYVFDEAEYERIVRLNAEGAKVSYEEMKAKSNYELYRGSMCINRAGEMLTREAYKYLEV